jgi:chromosome segregation ATPase
VAKKKTSKKKNPRKTKKSTTVSGSAEKAKKSSSHASKKSSGQDSPSREELDTILFQHLGGILILDEKNKIVYANDPAGKLLGKDAPKLLGIKVTKLKSFSEVTDQLSWQGKTCRLMLENTAERRLAKVKIELKKSQQELEASKEELEASKEELEAKKEELQAGSDKLNTSLEELQISRRELESSRRELESNKKELAESRRQAEDSEERAREMEEFLEQLEGQQSELESRLEQLKEQHRKNQDEWEETEAGLFKRVARLESSLQEKCQELEEGNRQKVEVEMALEAARRECVLLTHEVSQLQDTNSSQDSVLAQKVGTLQSLIMQADAKEAGLMRKVADLEAALKESQDQTTIAKYDWNEALEKLEAIKVKLENAEGRVKDAADELFKAWEVAEAAQKTAKAAEEAREKAEARTAELEQIFEKITPEEDDTIMGFL